MVPAIFLSTLIEAEDENRIALLKGGIIWDEVSGKVRGV